MTNIPAELFILCDICNEYMETCYCGSTMCYDCWVDEHGDPHDMLTCEDAWEELNE